MPVFRRHDHSRFREIIYMGHKTVRSTALYLRLTAEVYPELMKKVESSCSYVIPEVCHEGD